MGRVPAPGRRSGEGRPVVGGASGFCSVGAARCSESLGARVWRNVRVWTAVSETRLLLTCGLPAAGKTTLARQLAADRSALRLTQDEWLIALGSSPWEAPTREKVDHELWRLAQEVLRLGLSVVLDFGLWARIERDKMRLRGSRPWCRCRTALSRRAYGRTLAADRSEEHGATLEQLPDRPRRLRRVATPLSGSRCCRAGVVRPTARAQVNLPACLH
jgi:AAA domain